ncbi:MAG: isochorismatase family protein [Candidatus Cryptobacteroides sp.]|nr:isochorismatase family protein [Bacteroidales bacterium]MCI7749226.1 isochorismatase family protein [Bacteroidales bacterium]MDD7532015.1 isochorismatase family protein [Bacteroidales bacterium]MDY2858176.1 isochorismatase family protein [Candidatus Cryptobacteroides sp.]MDY5744013.1 isochorismatase family protein [Candidatus Cryptobacteroides sp.]
MKKDSATVVVDMLYDFIDGSLACIGGEEAVEETRKFLEKNLEGEGDAAVEILDTKPVLFIRDHHPADHSSFKDFGGIWPAHCVAGTRGGEIHEKLLPFVNEDLTFDKGCERAVEQYSGFDGRNAAGQPLGEVLSLMDIKTVYVCGIATEYCVRSTCEDLLKAGFKVQLLKDCLAYVNEEGHRKALEEMAAEGIELV